MSETRQQKGRPDRHNRCVIDDPETCYRAVCSRDPRFDGWFIVAVTSTGIYCRPSCPARTPQRAHMRFFPTSATAQAAGFRSCKRCRPDAAPGSPEWDGRADVVARAMRLIADGTIDREGASPGCPCGSATAPANCNGCSSPNWAPARWPWPVHNGLRPPAS